MKKTTSLWILALASCTLFGQVGINTTSPDPNSSLDVNGKVVIRNTDRSLTGVDKVQALFIEDDGTVIGVDIPQDLLTEDSSNNISINSVGSNNTGQYENIVLIDQQFNTQNNWDLELQGDNSHITTIIIRKSTGGGELKIRGIQGGTDGRRIRIINDSGADITFEEDNNSASNGNKIYIYTADATMESYGSCELIYSTAISNSGGHWNVVQLESTN